MRKKQVIVGLGLLVNDHNQLLLTLRNDPENLQTHNKWEIPGGKVEFGETVIQTVKREMKEEIGIIVEILDYPPIIESNVWNYTDKLVHVTLICYICSATENPYPANKEILDIQWVDEKSILKLEYLPKCDFLVKKARYMVSSRSKGSYL